MSSSYNLRARPARKTRPSSGTIDNALNDDDSSGSSVTINALNDDDFFLIFDYFKLQNLFPLRLVNHRWDALVQDKFRNRTELTVQVKHANAVPYNPVRSKQLIYVDNIEDVLTKKATSVEHEDPIESVGELISIQFQHVKSFAATLRQLLADNLQTLIVHWESSDNRRLTLVTLVSACPNLTRLSLWTSAPEHNIDSIHTAKVTLVERLCKILPQMEALTWLDLNCYHENYNYQLRFKELHLQTLLPQLERLSLCHFAKDPIGLLARAGQQLTHLKLDCIFPDFTSEQLHHLLTELNPSLATSITTLSLLSPTMSMLEVSPAFINLHTLKLQSINYHFSNFQYEMLATIAQIPSLRKLLLHEYHLLPTHPRPCSLPFVTSLTLTNANMLFRNFTNEDDPNQPGRRRVNVPAFCTALFAQFPSLKELTLVGPVYQKEVVRNRLDGALTPRLDKLNMFFDNYDDVGRLFGGGGRTRQTARKSTGGTAPRKQLYAKLQRQQQRQAAAKASASVL